MVLLHGLGDDMNNVRKLAEVQSEQGYGVLLVDLHGHGRTLSNHLKTFEALPAHLEYTANVEDIRDLLTKIGASRVSIVGHSYGGGIAYALAVELEKSSEVVVTSVHMLAPYVQRIDKFLSVYGQSPQFVRDEYLRWLDRTNIPHPVTDRMMGRLSRFVAVFTRRYDYAKALTNRALGIEIMKDHLMDPAAIQFMQKAYRHYFVSKTEKPESQLTEAELKEIETKVEASIKVTIGIRGFDLLDPSHTLPPLRATLQIIGAKHDKLVIPAQLMAFATRLDSAGKQYSYVVLEDPELGHDFPQTAAPSVNDHIRSSMSEAIAQASHGSANDHP